MGTKDELQREWAETTWAEMFWIGFENFFFGAKFFSLVMALKNSTPAGHNNSCCINEAAAHAQYV
jgi:hypothetical protein